MLIRAAREDSQEKVEGFSDGKRNWLTREEIYELVDADCHARRVRLRSDLFENVWATYNALRKRQALGEDTVSKRQLARDLYPDVGADYDAFRRKQASIGRWLRLLVRQGAISKAELRDPAGKTLGLRVELMPVSGIRALTRGCSSAGSSARIRIAKRKLRPQERHEARVRPWCPRAGRGAPKRFAEPVPLFSPLITDHPRGRGGIGPYGSSPPLPKKSPAARPRGPDQEAVDTIEPSAEQNATAALDRRLTAALGVGAAQTLRRAEDAFALAFGPDPPGELAYPLRLKHLPTIRELLWCLDRLDRYARLGQGEAGAGVELLAQRIELAAGDVAEGRRSCPLSLAYFLPELRAEGRRWKHTWAPRIKAERRRRGSSSPRRGVRSALMRGEVVGQWGTDP